MFRGGNVAWGSGGVHSLQHGPDGEAWRESGGEVFEGVDHQVDPEGTHGRRSHCSSVLLLENL